MVQIIFPWYEIAHRNGVVVDTGILLLHAFSLYEEGRYYGRVLGDIPPPHGRAVGTLVDDVLRAFPSYITPEVLAEFQALAERRGRFTSNQLANFLREYSLFPVREHYVPQLELIRAKSTARAWDFSYTDTSIVLAAKERGSPVLTNDRALRRLGNRLDVLVLHFYEDYYLHL